MINDKLMRMIVRIAVIALVTAALALSVYAEGEWPADIRGLEERDYSGYTVILHSNDVHGAIEGYAKMAWLSGRLSDMGAETILVDAGDYSQGAAEVNMNKGADAIKLMNAVGYDFAAIGNHEFDFGSEKMLDNLGSADFTVICANVLKDGELVFAPSAMYETESGLRIGFIGLETPETLTKTNPKSVAGYTILSGEDMYAAAQKETDRLIADSADLVIAVTHLGVDAENTGSGNGSSNLYANVSGVDLIIDGHSHTVMTSGQSGEPIQSTGTKFTYIGMVIISPEGDIEDRYLVPTEELGSDEMVAAEIQGVNEAVDEAYGEIIGYSEVALDGEKSTNRTGETNNGRLAGDALLWYARNYLDLPDDEKERIAVIINGGGLRTGLEAGDVTPRDIFNIYPFANTIVLIRVSGSELLEALEASTAFLPEPSGGYPQTANIVFTVDISEEYAAGELYPGSTYHRPEEIRRVSIESVCGQPFDPDAEYIIATSDFIADGGDTYYVFSRKERIDTGMLMDDIIVSYIEDALDGLITEEMYGQPRGEQTIITKSVETQDDGTDGETDEETSENTTYVVLPGDCLWSIAADFYGSGIRWGDIYEANAGQINDPSLIYPGQGLVIPAA